MSLQSFLFGKEKNWFKTNYKYKTFLNSAFGTFIYDYTSLGKVVLMTVSLTTYFVLKLNYCEKKPIVLLAYGVNILNNKVYINIRKIIQIIKILLF